MRPYGSKWTNKQCEQSARTLLSVASGIREKRRGVRIPGAKRAPPYLLTAKQNEVFIRVVGWQRSQPVDPLASRWRSGGGEPVRVSDWGVGLGAETLLSEKWAVPSALRAHGCCSGRNGDMAGGADLAAPGHRRVMGITTVPHLVGWTE